MILEIIKEFKWKLALIYPLLILQYSLFSLIPFLLGKAIDDLLKNNYKSFYLLIFVDIVALLIGYFLKRYDTRVYMNIFCKKAIKVILYLKEKNVIPSKIINRYGLVGYYSDFFEFSLPQIMQAIISVITSLIILFSTDYRIGLLCSIAFILMCLNNKICSFKTQKVDLNIQNKKEEITQSITDEKMPKEEIEKLCSHYIAKSDIDAGNFFCNDSLSIIMQATAILILINDNPSVGAITSTLMYADQIYAQSQRIFYFFMFMRSIENTNKLINENEGDKISPSL